MTTINTLSVAFTMDCENLNHLSGVGGTTSWDFSERSIRGFADLLETFELKATLFLCPETAVAHKNWLTELQTRGHELALHFHPDSFQDGFAKGMTQLGLYHGAIQKPLLQDGKHMWEDALGQPALCFRPGCFSANDETIPILADLGFRHGSMSSPGRRVPILGAIWEPGILDVHFTHQAIRSIIGDMDFVNVPLTVDWEIRFPHRKGWDLPQELMIERGDRVVHKRTITKNIVRQIQGNAPVPMLCAATHNVWPFDNPKDEKTEILKDMISDIKQCEEEMDVVVKGATVAEIADRFRNAS